ncbi:4-hydroxy-tetrahydrodipicolinate reductase [Clostridium cylindrosporum]|uniref:4-hydroxy-tetrahydrodipicolinate reductase n=1 Tax=Clostridium cylindrosporum DSM 605 TaxID=1121307 RepID=A0A0J8DER8_CLOCY|nr:4-hydroxy-tetrahydrodipicolinate reductase [Clostridium cylindrosporum]KMT22678.1 4-hydroxy-tetrahydrodipicolinate reductase DapB [Clostridium cylindrosporum DSM 605]
MKILLFGCNGRVGQVLTRIIDESNDMETVCGVDRNPEKASNNYPVYTSLKDVKENVDVVIDFSNHSCLSGLLEFGKSTKTPLVICTTGFTDEEKEAMKEASCDFPILHSGNMSVGINLLLSLVKKAANVLYPNFDIEVIEKHHNQKLDSPSGTALMIADAMKEELDDDIKYVHGRETKTEKRTQTEIGIHAVRAGGIYGEHTALFASNNEIVEVKHTALTRDVFADGAIKAAKFLVTKTNGYYSMSDVIK